MAASYPKTNPLMLPGCQTYERLQNGGEHLIGGQDMDAVCPVRRAMG